MFGLELQEHVLSVRHEAADLRLVFGRGRRAGGADCRRHDARFRRERGLDPRDLGGRLHQRRTDHGAAGQGLRFGPLQVGTCRIGANDRRSAAISQPAPGLGSGALVASLPRFRRGPIVPGGKVGVLTAGTGFAGGCSGAGTGTSLLSTVAKGLPLPLPTAGTADALPGAGQPNRWTWKPPWRSAAASDSPDSFKPFLTMSAFLVFSRVAVQFGLDPLPTCWGRPSASTGRPWRRQRA